MTERVDPAAAMRMATDIVIAFLGLSAIEPERLPQLVKEVRAALTDEGAPLAASAPVEAAPAAEAKSSLKPAVPIDKSVFPDLLISLEDGKAYRSLRRHLMTKYGLTPDAYRQKWGLPPDYPMVAPDYARDRSEVAKRIGLGTTRAAAAKTKPARRKAHAAAV